MRIVAVHVEGLLGSVTPELILPSQRETIICLTLSQKVMEVYVSNKVSQKT